MKTVMLSIRPEWCEKIAQGKKTIEVRKTEPTLQPPFKCYIYQTKPKYGDWNEKDGRVIGEFVCDFILDIRPPYGGKTEGTCLEAKELYTYAGAKPLLYGWHISELEIYDTPKELSEFRKPCIYGEKDVSCFLCDKSGYRPDMHIDCFNYCTRPPQSWCYVEEQI